MEKHKILPLMALGLLTFGTISTALPAGASVEHRVLGGEDDDATPPATVSGSGSGSGSGATPSGGASTGAGGMASTAPADAGLNLMWLAAGGAGIALLGASAGTSAVVRRRRAMNV